MGGNDQTTTALSHTGLQFLIGLSHAGHFKYPRRVFLSFSRQYRKKFLVWIWRGLAFLA